MAIAMTPGYNCDTRLGWGHWGWEGGNKMEMEVAIQGLGLPGDR